MAATNEEWAGRAKRFLKAELARVDLGYADLAAKLSDMGLPETEGSITVKVNRGTFPAWWCFAVLKAIGRETVRLDDL